VKRINDIHLLPLALITVTAALIGGLVLDNVYRGKTTATVDTCPKLSVLFYSDPKCKSTQVTASQHGWPFIVKKIGNFGDGNGVVFQNGFELSRDGQLSINTALAMFVGVVVYLTLLKNLIYRWQPSIYRDAPIISSSDFLSEPGLTSLYKGTFSGKKLNLLTNSTGRVMLNVDLGKNSHVHLLAFGAKAESSVFRESIASRGLQEIVLEGDFPEYFKIYCTPGQQIHTLQVLEPVTMAYLVDFCKSYDLEIYKDVLYVAKAQGAEDSDDTTTVVEDTKKLLEYHGVKLMRLGTEIRGK
jgi:hypothetical protein